MADAAVQPVLETPPGWSPGRRLAFRFFCCYWILYALPEGGRVSLLPAGEFVFRWWEKMVHTIVPWVAIHVFHVTGPPATYFPTGSGDTTLQYVTNLLYVVVSLAATLVWSILDRGRPNYRAMDAWLRVLVRYNLAFTLFGYGFVKVFPLQFRPTPYWRFVEPYGQFSPMGVLWSFMGASVPYIIFGGLSEVTGGVLLLFRRTTSLGAMVSFAVLLNVAVLNYCYDVPVKLYSTNLVLMALFLLVPDARRLLDVLVRNRPAPPADLNPVRFERRWLRIGSVVCWVLVVGLHFVGGIWSGWRGYKAGYVDVKRPPYYGIYDVVSGPAQWSKVVVNYEGGIVVRLKDDSIRRFPTNNATWSTPDADHVVLEGAFNTAPTTIRLQRVDPAKYPQTTGGFHWISEYPFNR